MGITSLARDSGPNVSIVRVVTTDDQNTALAANYITGQAANITAANNGTWTWLDDDVVLISASDGAALCEFTDANFSSLVPVAGTDSVTLPITVGGLAIYTSSQGQLGDTQSNSIATVNGSLQALAGTVLAGGSGTAGSVSVYPPTASRGNFSIGAQNATGNQSSKLQNSAVNQTTTWTLADPVDTNGQVLVGAGATPFVAGNLVSAVNTVGLMQDTGLNMQMVEISMTAAQWNGMYATPIQVLAAQGANTIVLVHKLIIDMTYGTTQFTGGGVVGAQYGNSAHLAGTLATATQQASDFTGATASTQFVVGGASGNSSQVAYSVGVNAAIYISNQSGAFAAGDSTFKVRLIYSVIPSGS